VPEPIPEPRPGAKTLSWCVLGVLARSFWVNFEGTTKAKALVNVADIALNAANAADTLVAHLIGAVSKARAESALLRRAAE